MLSIYLEKGQQVPTRIMGGTALPGVPCCDGGIVCTLALRVHTPNYQPIGGEVRTYWL